MRQTDDYIPIDIWHEAKDFVKEVTDEVEIYKIILQTALFETVHVKIEDNVSKQTCILRFS